MTDGNLPNAEQYLVTVLKDTGDTIFHRVRCNDNGHWETFGEVPRADLPFGPALTIGEAVLAELKKHPGRKLRERDEYPLVGSRGHHIAVYTSRDKPVPLTGLAYLKSLPVGTTWSYDYGQGQSKVDQFVVVDGGICWLIHDEYDHEQLWKWDGEDIKESEIRNNASPETCKPWKP